MDEDFELYNFLNDMNNFNALYYLQNFEEHFWVRRKYHVRNRIDPMIEFDDEEFSRRFRFGKNDVVEIYNLIDGPNTLEPLV